MNFSDEVSVLAETSEAQKLENITRRLKAEGKKIVFTSGCFDILHIGHVRYLTAARKLGDSLVVGLNSDRSVTALKGAGHPVIPASERAELLAALKPVDYVIIFNELTPERLIEQLRPDIHVKGGDYRRETLPEAALVESYGGKVIILDKVEGASTTTIIRRILSSAGKVK